MGSFTPHKGTHHFISNDTPISWASSLLRDTQCFISVSERMTHPTHGNIPYTGEHNVPSLSHRGTTNPSHGHTQLMVSLLGRITQFVSWRMYHTTVIINIYHVKTSVCLSLIWLCEWLLKVFILYWNTCVVEHGIRACLKTHSCCRSRS
jgi:hypothetical protein